MSKLKLSGKELRAIGYPEGPVISIAMNVMEKNFKQKDKSEALQLLRQVLADPDKYFEDEVLGKIAEQLLPKSVIENVEIPLNKISVDFNVFGTDYIEAGALDQMNSATKLPIAIAGALMPDAHQGYGLPIGGVLATENAVIPYGVGVDIGCRMCLSVFDIRPEELESRQNYFAREINENTLFGAGKEFKKFAEHEVLERKEFYETGLLRSLQSKAAMQLGSSGSGNHFVEFGIVEITEYDEILQLPDRKVCGLIITFRIKSIGCKHCQSLYKNCKAKKIIAKRSC